MADPGASQRRQKAAEIMAQCAGQHGTSVEGLITQAEKLASWIATGERP